MWKKYLEDMYAKGKKQDVRCTSIEKSCKKGSPNDRIKYSLITTIISTRIKQCLRELDQCIFIYFQVDLLEISVSMVAYVTRRKVVLVKV